MGHSDAVVRADAHFPAHRLGSRVLDLPGVATPDRMAAIRPVVPLDDAPAADLLATPDGARLPVQAEQISAARTDAGLFRGRFALSDAAAPAYLSVRTGETRVYGNAILRKGVVT